jgi:hypothetical protein
MCAWGGILNESLICEDIRHFDSPCGVILLSEEMLDAISRCGGVGHDECVMGRCYARGEVCVANDLFELVRLECEMQERWESTQL